MKKSDWKNILKLLFPFFVSIIFSCITLSLFNNVFHFSQLTFIILLAILMIIMSIVFYYTYMLYLGKKSTKYLIHYKPPYNSNCNINYTIDFKYESVFTNSKNPDIYFIDSTTIFSNILLYEEITEFYIVDNMNLSNIKAAIAVSEIDIITKCI